jgi:hypothetical protein
MNKKTIFYIGIYAAVAYGGWYLYNNTKKAYATKILKAGLAGGGEDALLAFDKDYLKEWSIAAKTGAPNFMYKGVNYVSKGGKALK